VGQLIPILFEIFFLKRLWDINQIVQHAWHIEEPDIAIGAHSNRNQKWELRRIFSISVALINRAFNCAIN